MKKLGLLLALALIFVGCARNKEEPKVSPQSKFAKEFANAPRWVLQPNVAGSLAAVGSAKIGPAGIQMAKEEALAAARDELARIIAVKVKNMFKRFVQTTGVGDQQTVDKVSVSVSKQVSKVLLSGSMQRDMWISPSDTLYVLVVIDPKQAQTVVRDAVRSSLRNERALWQMILAKHYDKELDKEIEKEFGE